MGSPPSPRGCPRPPPRRRRGRRRTIAVAEGAVAHLALAHDGERVRGGPRLHSRKDVGVAGEESREPFGLDVGLGYAEVGRHGGGVDGDAGVGQGGGRHADVVPGSNLATRAVGRVLRRVRVGGELLEPAVVGAVGEGQEARAVLGEASRASRSSSRRRPPSAYRTSRTRKRDAAASSGAREARGDEWRTNPHDGRRFHPSARRDVRRGSGVYTNEDPLVKLTCRQRGWLCALCLARSAHQFSSRTERGGRFGRAHHNAATLDARRSPLAARGSSLVTHRTPTYPRVGPAGRHASRVRAPRAPRAGVRVPSPRSRAIGFPPRRPRLRVSPRAVPRQPHAVARPSRAPLSHLRRRPRRRAPHPQTPLLPPGRRVQDRPELRRRPPRHHLAPVLAPSSSSDDNPDPVPMLDVELVHGHGHVLAARADVVAVSPEYLRRHAELARDSIRRRGPNTSSCDTVGRNASTWTRTRGSGWRWERVRR